MLAFLHRRVAAATEALVLATVLTMAVALSGLTAISGVGGGGAASPLGKAAGAEEVLSGVLSVEPASGQADGSHWKATLDVGGRLVAVRMRSTNTS